MAMASRTLNPYTLFYTASGLLTLASIVLLALHFELPPLAVYLSAISLAAFVLCGYDKSIAASKNLRVPEKVFWTVAFLGGSLGMLLGMKYFRHKTKKTRFQFYLLLVIVMQLALLKFF